MSFSQRSEKSPLVKVIFLLTTIVLASLLIPFGFSPAYAYADTGSAGIFALATPATGDNLGNIVFIILGILIVALAILIFILVRRRRKDEDE